MSHFVTKSEISCSVCFVVVVKDGVQELSDVWLVKVQGRFREEVDKFIEAAKKHATTLTENKDTIICPCKDCKNHVA